MKKQQSLSDMEYENRRKRTKRDEFLEIMEEIVPWDELVAIIEPYYYKNKLGRKPRGIELMLRMYLLQVWFSLSDEGIEDAIYDSYAMRTFMGLNFMEEQVPDATTLCKFRAMMNANGIGEMIFRATKEFLEENGKLMHGGTIVDATIIDAPTSTKNAEGQRDPEMHQTKKGNQWYFGMKYHVGVDAGTGYVHSLEVTAANEADVKAAEHLLREDDEVVYGDSAYRGLERHLEGMDTERIEAMDFRINSAKPYRKNVWENGPGIWWFRMMEYQKSRVRSKVEYVFRVVKNIFGFRKTRYRGLAKNRTLAYLLMSSANYYMCAIAKKVCRLPVSV